MLHLEIFHGMFCWIGTQFVAVINFQVNMEDRFGQVMIQNLRVRLNYDFEFDGQAAALSTYAQWGFLF